MIDLNKHFNNPVCASLYEALNAKQEQIEKHRLKRMIELSDLERANQNPCISHSEYCANAFRIKQLALDISNLAAEIDTWERAKDLCIDVDMKPEE